MIDFPSPLRASTVFLLLLHLLEVIVQACKLPFPEAAKGLDPVSDILERNRDKPAWTPLRVAPAHYQAGALQHVQVLGDRGLAQGEGLHEFRYIRFSSRETSEDSASCGIPKRAEGQVKAVRVLINLHMAILPNGDIKVKPKKTQVEKLDAFNQRAAAESVHDRHVPSTRRETSRLRRPSTYASSTAVRAHSHKHLRPNVLASSVGFAASVGEDLSVGLAATQYQ